MDPFSIINKYYTPGTPLYETLVVHSRCVAHKALECARNREIEVDIPFVEEAAMLHDIGIFRTNAPDIYCTGPLPYICHGTEGSLILRQEGLPRHALVCERHTGSGLTAAEIESRNLPIPVRDMLPFSTEERLICYADKFFSKSGILTEEKPLEHVIRSLERHGPDVMARFLKLHEEFGSL